MIHIKPFKIGPQGSGFLPQFNEQRAIGFQETQKKVSVVSTPKKVIGRESTLVEKK